MDPMPVGTGGLAGLLAVGLIETIRMLKQRAAGGTVKERLVRLETKVDLILQTMELRAKGK